MRSTSDNERSSEETIDQVVAAILESDPPVSEATREDWIARYPQFADELSEFFTAHDALEAIAAPVRQAMAPHACVPNRFGDYELLDEIARGGMGVVYRARQVSLKRIVAVKLLLAGRFAGATQTRRFEQEARAMAGLQHPNLVTVHDVGRTESISYFSMDYIEGTNLAAVSRDRTLSPGDSARYIKDIADAVHFAHDHGILHRDLKPSNILIDSAGRPRVTDFGLLMRFDADTDLTISGAIVGTPSYMSPEQASGLRDVLGPASDVYSLGAILYELLTGRPPFLSNSPAETLSQIQVNEPPSIEQLSPSVPRDLKTITRKCLEKDRSQRYDTAQALANDLQRFLDHEPIHARPASALYRFRKWVRRRPAAAALAFISSIAAVTVVSLLAVAIIALGRVRENEQALQSTNAELSQALARSRRLEYQSRLRIYATDMQGAFEAWEHADIGLMRRLLAAHVPAPEMTDVRGFEWHYLSSLLERSEDSYAIHDGSIYGVAASPDGRWIAACGEDAMLRLWSPSAGGKIRTLSGHEKDVIRVAFSPDSNTLVSAGDDGTVRLWDVSSGRELLVLPLGHSAGCMAISPDWSTIAASDSGGRVRLWDSRNGMIRQTFEEDHQVEDMEFSPDGKWLAVASHHRSREGRVRLWDWREANVRPLVQSQPGVITAIEFAPSGRVLASAHGDGTVRLWNAASGKLITALQAHSEKIYSIEFSADGRLLASSCRDCTIRLSDWQSQMNEFTADVHRLDATAEAEVLKGHDGHVWSVAFALDGKLLSAGADGTVKRWETAPHAPSARELPANVQTAHLVEPNRLITGDYDGAAIVWDIASGLPTAVLDIVPGPVRDITSTADGLVVIAGTSSDVTLVDAITGRRTATLRRHTADVYALAASPDGQTVVTGDAEGTIMLWDAATGRHLDTLRGHDGAIAALVCSPDGLLLASASHDRTLRLWEMRSGRSRHVIRGHPRTVQCVAFSPDATLVASGAGDSTARVWDVATGRELATLAHESPVNSMAFSADGATLVTGSEKGVASVWHVPTGEPLGTLAQLQRQVLFIDFSQDRRALTMLGETPRDAALVHSISFGGAVDGRAAAARTRRPFFDLAAEFYEVAEQEAVVEQSIRRTAGGSIRGKLTVQGPDAAWHNSASVDVRDGTAIVENGALVTCYGATIRSSTPRSLPLVAVRGAGSRWLCGGTAHLLGNGTPVVSVEDGGQFAVHFATVIRGRSGADLSVNGSGSELALGKFLKMQWGTLQIQNAGAARCRNAQIAAYEIENGTRALVQIAGDGSLLQVDNSIILGRTADQRNAPAQLTILQRGLVVCGDNIYVEETGTLTLADGAIHAARLNLRNGRCEGFGIVRADVVNAGIVSSVSAVDILQIEGDYRQTENGKLRVSLQSPEQGNTARAAIVCDGTARLDGTVEIELSPGSTPQHGAEFVLLSAALISGDFERYILPDLPDGLSWQVDVNAQQLSLRIDADTGDVE